MAQVKITVRPNGPFRVEAPEGSVELVDAAGHSTYFEGPDVFNREVGAFLKEHRL